MNKNNQPKAKSKIPVRRIVILIILIYVVISILPVIMLRISRAVWERKRNTDSNRTAEHIVDLRIQDAVMTDITDSEEWKSGQLKETVPELKGFNLEPDSRLCRCEITVRNNGMEPARYDGAIYLGSDDGYIKEISIEREVGSKEMDTRVIPPGRTSTVTMYGQVSNGTRTAKVKTYYTESAEPEELTIPVPDK